MKSQISNCRFRTAFTLTEMLVVLGIILLLAGMLFPMITRARRAAALTRCLAQIAQVGKGLTAFAEAHDGAFPAATPAGPGSGISIGGGGSSSGTEGMKSIVDIPGTEGPLEESRGGGGNAGMSGNIREFLKPYLGSDAKVWKCPEQPVKPPTSSAEPYAFVCNESTGEFFPGYWYVVGGTWSQGYMADIGGAGGRFGKLPVLQYDRNGAIDPTVPRGAGGNKWPLSKIVLFTDSSMFFHSRLHVRPAESGGGTNFVANFAFLDGHAETVRFGSMMEYRGYFQPGAMIPPEPMP